MNVSEWNEFICGEFHRAGTLCGECDRKKNFFPSLLITLTAYTVKMAHLHSDHT